MRIFDPGCTVDTVYAAKYYSWSTVTLLQFIKELILLKLYKSINLLIHLEPPEKIFS